MRTSISLAALLSPVCPAKVAATRTSLVGGFGCGVVPASAGDTQLLEVAAVALAVTEADQDM